MDRIETNFRLALLSIRELKDANERQGRAIDKVVETLGAAFESVQVLASTQDALDQRVSALEADVAELKGKAS